MARDTPEYRHQYRKGFLKFQRLGAITFAPQERWENAPESVGLWAFPYPHFELGYAYHKYLDLLPKELRSTTDPAWYLSEETDQPLEYPLEFRGEEPVYRDPQGTWHPAYLSGEFWDLRHQWVEKVGRKVLPLREFWYSGDLYSHISPSGERREDQWYPMAVEKFAKLLSAPGVAALYNAHDPSGKPRNSCFSKDHLEVFIPRGRGVIRSKP